MSGALDDAYCDWRLSATKKTFVWVNMEMTWKIT